MVFDVVKPIIFFLQSLYIQMPYFPSLYPLKSQDLGLAVLEWQWAVEDSGPQRIEVKGLTSFSRIVYFRGADSPLANCFHGLCCAWTS